MEAASDVAIRNCVQLPMGDRKRGMSSCLDFGYEYDCWQGLMLVICPSQWLIDFDSLPIVAVLLLLPIVVRVILPSLCVFCAYESPVRG